MNYHIVLHRAIDIDSQEQQARADQSPRHAMKQLAQRLGANIHAPHDKLFISPADRLGSKLVGAPENWALARKLLAEIGPEDVVFCGSETCGLPIAAFSRGRSDRPKIAVFVHNVDRPRGRLALRLIRAAAQVDWFVACSYAQMEFVRRYLNLPKEQASFVWDQTDLQFFRPGPVSPTKRRPLVMSVGLEQRDYRTLAAATADLPVDVKISGLSKDARAIDKAFPVVMPDNMSRQFYEWPDLRQLYWDADVVVVSTFPNRYAAGVQGMVEAMACGRPTVVTSTEGLHTYLAGNDGVVQVSPGDVAAMRQAIVHLLKDDKATAQLAQAARHYVQQRHDSDHYIEILAQGLERLGGGLPVSAVK